MVEFELDEQSGRLYVVWDVDKMGEEQEIGIKMLMNNQIPGIVPISCQYVNDILRVYYETAEMVSLDERYRAKNISVKTAIGILQAVIKAIQAGEPYFMGRDNFLLSEKYVFLSKDGSLAWICYVPGVQQDVYGSLKRVMEFMLEHLEHGDRSETAFFYGIYDMLSEKKHTLEELAECLERQSIVSQKNKKGKKKKENTLAVVDEEKNTVYFSLLQTLQKVNNNLDHILVPHEIPLQGTLLRIGRQQQQDICLAPEQISREHAILYCEENELQIEDQNSLNGTYINGRKISAHVKVRCSAGDVITFADIPYEIVER